MAQFDSIIQEIETATGMALQQTNITSIGGGCINAAYRLDSDDRSFFIKVNSPNLSAMFEAEAQGLQEMAAINAVRVPKVICYGVADGYSYLALEYIPLGSLRGNATKLLGQQLAELHKTQQPYFGWHMDNTIGSTPQINDREHDWLTFWQHERLGKQLEFAAKNGFGGRLQSQGEKLQINLDKILQGHQPHPSLLHGDLWGGNASADDEGNPVIFDPACYYGDREADLAMTELFGGFGGDFFAAYNDTYPVEDGYPIRKTLYNLYHIINHLNLFGGGYLGQAESMIDRLLAQI
ncbi:fructosamine kinase family protein [Methylophaga sp.]|uniref:fructosamine kinase family protein n=1 Tax=Methylophaga sp. TaxID=2024840 RepID=UPI003F6A1CEB